MNALWWWIDRWRKSTAYTDMTLEEQGAYRNLLDEAQLRGGPLPNDERILAKACGDARAWRRVRPAVIARFTLAEDGWRNETLDAVIRESKRRATKQKKYRHAHGNGTGNETGNGGSNRRGSPDPDPSPIVPVLKNRQEQAPAPDGRSKRPIFTGQRLTVFEWMFDDCRRTLGEHLDAFGLDEWFYDVDQRAVDQGLVIPKRDGGEWLQAQLVMEAQRRGMPLRFAAKPAAVSGSTCPHVPRCSSTTACIERTVADGRAARSA